jgi:hypothetical protein
VEKVPDVLKEYFSSLLSAEVMGMDKTCVESKKGP